MKLSCCDWLDRVRSLTKTRQYIDVMDHISLIYAENKTELSGPIWPGTVCDEN